MPDPAATVHYAIEGAIAVLTIDNPPVNALGHAVRAALLDGLQRAASDPAVAAILLVGAGRTFIAGADIKEFGKPPQPPGLPEVIAEMDRIEKPLVAALHGSALGGGLETALGCHYRLALAGAQVGLPEVKLGILPGAGGTQRLPRLVGADKALALMTGGDFVPAVEALDLGIVDALSDETDVRAAGLAYTRRLLDEGAPIRRVRDLPPPAEDAAVFAAHRARLETEARGLFSPFRIVDCVEAAARLPFDAAIAEERRLFQQCLDSPQRAGLIHAFFGERAATKIDGQAKDVAPQPIEAVLVIGPDDGAHRLAKQLEGLGLAAARAADVDAGDAALSPADLLLGVGAAGERLGAGGFAEIAGARAALAVPSAGRTVELLFGPDTAPGSLAAAAALAKRLKRLGVPVRAGYGSPAARLAAAYRRAGEALQGEGAAPAAIDAAAAAFGMARGPFGGIPESETTPDPAVADRLLDALAREGERLLADGAVARPVAIDIVAIETLGFPRWRGGPMFAVGLRE
ncbi:MAG: enoyl-CoA hydratase/isomerase family protein [Alphaproteobacteria bacterium]|nr:enoyl-CoA hydratase/isomerase family protein [Alphaproteobacteria bacterium]